MFRTCNRVFHPRRQVELEAGFACSALGPRAMSQTRAGAGCCGQQSPSLEVPAQAMLHRC